MNQHQHVIVRHAQITIKYILLGCLNIEEATANCEICDAVCIVLNVFKSINVSMLVISAQHNCGCNNCITKCSVTGYTVYYYCSSCLNQYMMICNYCQRYICLRSRIIF